METRQLGTTDLQLSVIGLGTWAIGGGDWAFGWGDQDERESIATINQAIELGINWIDTAPIYGFGRSEEIVGRAIGSMPSETRPLIATKCGRLPQPDGSIGKSLKRQSVIDECEASLQRLGIDCIDLYQIHWPEPDEEIEEAWQTMVDLKQQGKVRHIGVSNHQASQLRRLQAIHPVASLQPPYSMIAREAEKELLPYCQENGIGVICYSPMGKGLLTGSFTLDRARTLSNKDHRSRDPRFQSPQLEINLMFVEGLRQIAEHLGWSVPDVALAWVLRRPEITAAIVGGRRPDQITQIAASSGKRLDDAALVAIDGLLKARDDQLAALDHVPQARV